MYGEGLCMLTLTKLVTLRLQTATTDSTMMQMQITIISSSYITCFLLRLEGSMGRRKRRYSRSADWSQLPTTLIHQRSHLKNIHRGSCPCRLTLDGSRQFGIAGSTIELRLSNGQGCTIISILDAIFNAEGSNALPPKSEDE